eukprot:m.131026 g.131026  ORF g.131026 m.131026 type:complete len:611 (-) comp29516_c0_seq1:105-1937(-)
MFAHLNSPLSGRGPAKLIQRSTTVEGTPFKTKKDPNPVSLSWLRAFQQPTHSDSGSCQETEEDDSEENMLSICLALSNPSIDNGAWTAPWFRERCDGDDAIDLLVNATDGGFVVHNNLSEKALGFSYKYDGVVRHTAIELLEGNVNLFGDRDHRFVTLSDLVHYYTHNWGITETCYSLPCPLSTDFELADGSRVAPPEAAATTVDETPTLTLDHAVETNPTTTKNLKHSKISEPRSQLSEPRESKVKFLNGRRSSNQNHAPTHPPSHHTGIAAHVDDAARETDYFLGSCLKIAAREILANDEIGTFVVFEDKNPAVLNLSYNIAGGCTLRTQILHKPGVGIHLLDSTTTFATLSQLVSNYAGLNNEYPNMLRVPRPCEKKGKNRLPNWLQLKRPKAHTNLLLDMNCDGSFVVRSGQTSVDHLVLSYAYRGRAQHESVRIRRVEAKYIKYALQLNPELLFASIAALVAYYSANVDGLKCALKDIRIDEQLADMLPERHTTEDSYPAALLHNRIDSKARDAPWLCVHLSKEKALANLDRDVPGMFVVRRNAQLFATLSVVVSDRKVYNAHIIECEEGIHLKSSTMLHTSLFKLIKYHQQTDQEGLPQSLILW